MLPRARELLHIERASRSYVRQVLAPSFLCDVIERKPLPAQIRINSCVTHVALLCDVIEESAPLSLHTVIMRLSWLYVGVDFSTTSSRNRHLGEVRRVLLLLVVRSLALELLMRSSWGHLGPSWGHFAAVLRLYRISMGAICVRRHRGFGTLILQRLRSSFKAILVSVFCHGAFLCDVIEDSAPRAVCFSHLRQCSINLAYGGCKMGPR